MASICTICRCYWCLSLVAFLWQHLLLSKTIGNDVCYVFAYAVPSYQQQQQQYHRSRSTMIDGIHRSSSIRKILPIELRSFPRVRNNKEDHRHLRTTLSNVIGGSIQRTADESFFSSITKIISAKDIISLLSVAAFIGIDVSFRRLFQFYSIAFPSSLGACGIVLLSLLLFQSSTLVNKYIVPFLQFGATLLSKWLPVFFVPSLITLPLSTSLDTSNTIEMTKILSILIVGFVCTLLSTSYSVTLLRYFKNAKQQQSSSPVATAPDVTKPCKVVVPPSIVVPAKSFSDVLFYMLCIGAMSTGIGSIITKGTSKVITFLFLLYTTLSAFVFGARLPSSFKKLIHPLVTCTTCTWSMIAVLSKLLGPTTNVSFQSLLVSYKTGRLTGISTCGAGDILLFLLGPAVVSLAISMYEKRQLMKQNIYELCTAITVSTLGGLYGTAMLVRLLNIVGSSSIRLSLLSRNITSPLAMAIANILGADVSLAVSMVVITGLFGANFGATILNAFGIQDPVARGLGIGAAAHGLGTAAFTNETDAFPFAAISMALTASAATVAVSIPLIRKSLIAIAVGA